MSDLTQIQTFIEVAENGSFAEASRKLALPRSTVSARIQALEKRLRVRLFNRNTRRVSLTNEGSEYLEQCQQALSLLRTTEEKFANAHRLSGHLRLTVPVAMPKGPLAELLADFSLHYPDLSVDVVVTDEALDLVAENIDLAIRGRAPGDLDLIARELSRSEVSYFASPAYLESIERGADFVLAKHCIFELGKPCSGSVPLSTTNFELARELAVRDKGIVVLPDEVCAESVQRKELVKIALPDKPEPLAVYLVYPARIHMAPRVRVLVDFIVESYL
ncbi:MAG: DNA-binding transcriptional LysR family regulator [Oleispira sp.]|jgi:DNA-binding transcriptional LysR family regulator